MEYINIEGQSKPVIMYEPYIYKEIIDCTKFYIIKQENKKGIHVGCIYKDDPHHVKNKYHYRRK